MLTAKLKILRAVVLAVGMLGLGAGAVATQLLPRLPQATATDKPTNRVALLPEEPSKKDAKIRPLADPDSGESVEICGRVLSPDGKPVANAKLSYRPERFNHEPEGFYTGPVTGTADAVGRVRVP